MKNIQNPINPNDFTQFSRRHKPKNNFSNVNGFDTETKKGYARIGATQNEYFNIDNIDDVFSFLCKQKHNGKRNFFFNLKFDFEVLFKHDLDYLINLTTSNYYENEKYKIFYLNGKMLKIKDKKHRKVYEFYDIFPFYLSSLAKCSKKYLGLESSELKGDRDRLFNLYDNETIGTYCIEDAEHTKLLAELFIKNLNQINLFPKRLISCGNISEQYTLKNADIPKFHETPRPIQNMFWLSYRGGWFDTWKRGFFPKAYQYDIKSAYPTVMRNLLDTREGKWVNYVDTKQKLGVLKVILNKGEDSCISTKLKQRTTSPTIYPFIDEGVSNYITLSEYKELKHYYKIDIINAWSFCPEIEIYPYRKLVDSLYSLKESSRDDKGKYIVIKQIYNSLYGKTVQKIKDGETYKAGSLFNPCYASEITAGCRLQMWKACKDNKKHVLSIMTDGLITDKKLPLKIGTELGEWTSDYDNKPCVILKTGVYQFLGNKPKRRGMLRLPDLVDELLYNSKSTITLTYTRPRHFKESIIQHKESEIGVFLKDTRNININNDVKRLWISQPKKASDLLSESFTSEPIPLSLLTGH